jgi:thermostable 8-oxoguanine DNA glycosylase
MHMAFPDTISITVNAVAKTLIRIKDDGYSSEYRLRNAGVDEFRLFIRNTSYLDKATQRNVDRHAVEFLHMVFPVAPATVPTVRKVYTVLENQQVDTIVDPVKFAAGFGGFLTEANLTKLLNYES